jgi:formate dehydrogenase subunit gamma
MARVLSKATIEAMLESRRCYPTPLASLLPALHLAQDELGHVPEDAELDIAETLEVALTRVHEAVTFYSMFRSRAYGRHVVKMCRSIACELRGGHRLIEHAERYLGIKSGETTADGRITLEHEECLASCGTGPAVWCDGRLVENLTADKLEVLLASLP